MAYHFLFGIVLLWMGLNGPHFDVPLILVRILAQNRGKKTARGRLRALHTHLIVFLRGQVGETAYALYIRKGEGSVSLLFWSGAVVETFHNTLADTEAKGFGVNCPVFGEK